MATTCCGFSFSLSKSLAKILFYQCNWSLSSTWFLTLNEFLTLLKWVSCLFYKCSGLLGQDFQFRGVFRNQANICDEAFSENSQQLETVNLFS